MLNLKTVLGYPSRQDADAIRIALHRHAPEVKVVSTCTTPLGLKQQLKRQQPDLLFLSSSFADVGKRYGLMRQLESAKPYLILTAKEPDSRFINQLVDLNHNRENPARFLKQPARAEELKTLIASVKTMLNGNASPPNAAQLKRGKPSSHEWLLRLNNEHFLSARQDRNHLIPISQVCYCKADGNYVQLFYRDASAYPAREIIRCPIGTVEKLLASLGFIRVHASYIVNLNWVDLRSISLANGDMGSGGCLGIKDWGAKYKGVIPLARSKKAALRAALMNQELAL